MAIRLGNGSASEIRTATSRLLGLSAVACLSVLPACTTNVDIFRTHEGRAAAAAEATSSVTAGTPPRTASNTDDLIVEPSAAPANEDTNCKAGHYVGTFNGTYHSVAWGNGAPPLTISATASFGRPGLEFWLERIPRDCQSDEEFCPDFTVKGGKIRGHSNPFSTGDEAAAGSSAPTLAIRFEIDFGGNLDCSRGQFEGLLENGCYDLATLLFRFNGTAPAMYDAATSSFTDGMWKVTEEPPADAWQPPDPNIGGRGTWQATLVNDAAGPAAESVGLCGPPAPAP